MSIEIVVVTGEGGDGAATREVAALSQGATSEQQRQLERQIEQTTRERVQAVIEARTTAREGALNAAQAEGQATQAAQVPQVPAVPAPPARPTEPRVVITRPDGRQVIINGSGVQHATSAAQGVPPDVQVAMPEIPMEMVVIVIAFFVTLAFIAVGIPLARAFARRMDRQSAGAGGAAFPHDVSDRIERIEHAVEAIAIEVERVSEGQRFTTKLLAEMRSPAPLSAGSPAAAGNAYAGEGR